VTGSASTLSYRQINGTDAGSGNAALSTALYVQGHTVIGVARNLSWGGAQCWICHIFPGRRIEAPKVSMGRGVGEWCPLPTGEKVWEGQ